jgi:hypothetical protein
MSLVAAAIIASVAAVVLDKEQRAAFQAFVTGPHVQITEEEVGHNLVDHDW